MSPIPDVTWAIRIGEETVSAAYRPASTTPRRGLAVCGHGAGGHLGDRGMLQIEEVLGHNRLDVVRFNFLYREQGSRRPDPMPRLLDCWASVVGHALSATGNTRLFLGGRSMGGRAASVLAAEGFPCDGLLLFAYPLHPAGRPERLRDAHLGRIGAPVLCMNGTRDDLCRRDLMEAVLSRLGRHWTMHWLEGADHGFRLRRADGRSEADVVRELQEAVAGWLAHLGGPGGQAGAGRR